MPDGFAEIAEQHLDDVYAYLVYLTGDRATAEDLAAETFEKALRVWKQFDPRRASAKTWLCQIARSRALDHFRAESEFIRYVECRDSRFAFRKSFEAPEKFEMLAHCERLKQSGFLRRDAHHALGAFGFGHSINPKDFNLAGSGLYGL